MRPDFSNTHITIIGDIIFDRYIHGQVNRISPEAPVPIVHVRNETHSLGGAANVAANIAGLRGNVHLIGLIGEDAWGRELKQKLVEENIGSSLVTTKRPTTTKVRVMGNRQQMMRLDFEQVQPNSPSEEERLLEALAKQVGTTQVLILSDYGKGVVTPELAARVIKWGRENRIPILVDPKGPSWEKYRGAYMITPNLKELGDLLGLNLNNEDSLVEQAAHPLPARLGIENVLVTRADHGLSLFRDQNYLHVPTQPCAVFDVSGAGDTVIATMALATASKMEMKESLRLANITAGIVVGKSGTQPVYWEELPQ